jgi:hypothetical protein
MLPGVTENFASLHFQFAVKSFRLWIFNTAPARFEMWVHISGAVMINVSAGMEMRNHQSDQFHRPSPFVQALITPSSSS